MKRFIEFASFNFVTIWRFIVQYRSKVSYHLACRVSRDENRVSPRETRLSSRQARLSSRENQWSIYFGINCKHLACEKTINFSRRVEVYPAGTSGFSGSCLQAASRETNLVLQGKNLSVNGSYEKLTPKMFCQNSHAAVALFFSL